MELVVVQLLLVDVLELLVDALADMREEDVEIADLEAAAGQADAVEPE